MNFIVRGYDELEINMDTRTVPITLNTLELIGMRQARISDILGTDSDFKEMNTRELGLGITRS